MVDKDRVVQISTMTGTNKGGFMDLPSTGDRVSIPVVLIFTLKDEKIVEEQRAYDLTGVLVQAPQRWPNKAVAPLEGRAGITTQLRPE
jgi:predicted ester cyclase